MIASPLPSHPWEKVASDLFQLNGKTYLLVDDYFSWYMEVWTLATTTSASVIRALKATFGRHGVPAALVSDNGPQYNSTEVQEFPLPWCRLSHTELLIGRHLQTDIPHLKRVFISDWPYLTSFHVKKRQEKAEYDRCHRVKPLPPLPDDELIWVSTEDRHVTRRVVQPANTPMSYIYNGDSILNRL